MTSSASDPQSVLLRALERAGPVPRDRVDEEQVALVSTGRTEGMSDEERRRVLDTIAADTNLAEWVAQTRGALMSEARPQDTETGRRAGRSGSVLFRIGTVGWALAACVTLALGVWRVSEPTPTFDPSGPGYRMTEHGTSAESTIQRQTTADRVRDVGLAVGGAVWVGLTIPLAWRIARRRR